MSAASDMFGVAVDLEGALRSSDEILRRAIAEFDPTHIVGMVSGGRDSAASTAVTLDLGHKFDLLLHGNTRTGIQQTTQFVASYYGSLGPEFDIADAGSTFEARVMRKGFYGKGFQAHRHSYHELKATPFRKAISRNIRQGRKGYRVMLVTGARKFESDNRRLNMPVMRREENNLWVNPCHAWTADVRDAYTESRGIPINPVAVQLCRSGECMCGTQQSAEDRTEAASIYPEWGKWLDELDAAAKAQHGWGWNDPGPAYRDPNQQDLFQPMCVGCARSAPFMDGEA